MYQACLLKIKYAIKYKLEEFTGKQEREKNCKSNGLTRTKKNLVSRSQRRTTS